MSALGKIDEAFRYIGESCVFYATTAAVTGFSAGVGLGMFFGTFEGAHGALPGTTTSERLKYGFRQSISASFVRSKHLGKSFAVVGFVYALMECNLAKIRGRTDIFNAIFAGASAGGILGLAGVRSPRNMEIPDTKPIKGIAIQERFTRWREMQRKAGTSKIAKRAVLGSLGFAAFSCVAELAFDHFVHDKPEDVSFEAQAREWR